MLRVVPTLAKRLNQRPCVLFRIGMQCCMIPIGFEYVLDCLCSIIYHTTSHLSFLYARQRHNTSYPMQMKQLQGMGGMPEGVATPHGTPFKGKLSGGGDAADSGDDSEGDLPDLE
mmetsp:Transcript_14476/g.21265  ORF Transcript_14476/g.21265 Transcript_14476/m.21265 type:complete len:115 (-) Transcript_14476:118-462(-)